jgi:hypothetical protein
MLLEDLVLEDLVLEDVVLDDMACPSLTIVADCFSPELWTDRRQVQGTEPEPLP